MTDKMNFEITISGRSRNLERGVHMLCVQQKIFDVPCPLFG